MKLRQFPEKERALWRVFDRITFEQEIAAEGIDSDRIHYYLLCPAYFDLLNHLQQ